MNEREVVFHIKVNTSFSSEDLDYIFNNIVREFNFDNGLSNNKMAYVSDGSYWEENK